MSLIEFCKSGDITKAEGLLENGKDPNACDERGRSCLHIAATTGNENLAKLLLLHGANSMIRDKQGNIPLHYCGHRDILLLLYRNGSNMFAW